MLVTIARDVDASAVRGRFVRVAVSVAMFSVGLLCMLHIVLVSGDQGTLMGRRFMMTYGMYGVGLIFYVFRIPEAWSPGTFDFMVRTFCKLTAAAFRSRATRGSSRATSYGTRWSLSAPPISTFS